MIVENYISKNDNFLTQSYFPIQDKVTFISFWLESNARLRSSKLVVGMWRVKSIKPKQQKLNH